VIVTQRFVSIRVGFQTFGTERAETFLAKANAVNARFDVARFSFVVSFGLFVAVKAVIAESSYSSRANHESASSRASSPEAVDVVV